MKGGEWCVLRCRGGNSTQRSTTVQSTVVDGGQNHGRDLACEVERAMTPNFVLTCMLLLVRGRAVIRTRVRLKILYIPFVLLSIFGPDYCCVPP